MIRTDSNKEEEARALALRVKKEVNQRYKLAGDRAGRHVQDDAAAEEEKVRRH